MNQNDLWKMSPEDFNKWRQDNDLPRLIEFFKEELPFFKEWLSDSDISDRDFCLAPHTGEWFIGKEEVSFVEYTDDGVVKYDICQNFDSKFKFLSKHRAIVKKRITRFVPYLTWGMNRCGKESFILTDKANKSYSNTIGFGSWHNIGGQSQAKLLRVFDVLKLGQIKLHNGVLISPRNLDFVDLDGLLIEGDFHGSYATEINFSSCQNISIINGGLHHVNFRNCEVAGLTSKNSRLQDFVFESCTLDNFNCSQSTINGFSVVKSRFSSPLIDGTEIQRFVYEPDLKYKRYEGEVDICRRLRTVFQSIGRRSEAQQYYYLERCYERKFLWSPYLSSENRKIFPNRRYAGRLSNLYDQWLNKHFTTKQTAIYFIHTLLFHINIWVNPKYAIKAIPLKINYLGSLVSFLVWGYGLKVSRVIGFGMLIMALFAFLYYLIGPTNSKVIDSIYFSIVTFTTLGYGDIQPTGDGLRLLCAFEALLGAITMGLIIGTFSNRTNY
jgi:hypothetical protein